MVASRENLFNTPVESALRSLIVLDAISPRQCDVQRMVVYDYLLVHSGDIEDGPESLHGASPLRSGELLVRRSLVERGLELLFKKGLAEKTFSPLGIVYSASPIAATFIGYFESGYARKTMCVAKWIHERFGTMDDLTLRNFADGNIGKWGTEFLGDPTIDDDTEL